MQIPLIVQQIPALAPIFEGANVIDVKTIESATDLREFLAGIFSYQPAWVTFLYRVRAVFVRFLGMRQSGIPRKLEIAPQAVPMRTGAKMSFFRVTHAQENHYWVAEVDDKHLKATLMVVAEQAADNKQRYNIITVVHYHKWTGPLYYNVIRPFHHLVVNAMIRTGARYSSKI